MQPYLKDGYETKVIIFNAEAVRQYNAFFNISEEDVVQPLYCAKLWPEFTQIHDIKVNIHYLAQMCVIEQKKVRQFMKYVLELQIYKNKSKCITIRQTFMEKF